MQTVKMTSYSSEAGLSPNMSDAPIWRWLCQDTRRVPYDMEAEIRIMRPQAKEGLGLPEAGRGKKGSSPRALALPTP